MTKVGRTETTATKVGRTETTAGKVGRTETTTKVPFGWHVTPDHRHLNVAHIGECFRMH